MLHLKFKYYRIILLALITHSGCWSFAQNQFSFKNYNVKDGLSHNFTRNVIQDDKGFIWIATGDGLNKFDGYTFKIFRNDTEDPSSISHNNINYMAEDKNGKLWLGTWGGGVNIFDPVIEKSIRLPYEVKIDGEKINTSFVNVLFNDSKGNMWIGTNEAGLFKFDVDDYSFKLYQHKTGVKNGLSRNRVMSIAEDDKGNIWLATLGGGLNKLNPTSEQFTIYKKEENNPDALNTDQLYSVLFDQKGRLWVGSWGDGLYRLDIDSGKFISYRANSNNPKNILSNDIWTMVETSEGKVWFGSDKGPALYNEQEDNFHTFTHDPYDEQSVPANSIKALSEDNEGRLWIGTYNGGISLLDQKAKIFPHYYQKKNEANFLSSNDVTAFLELEDGNILIGTDGGGINIFNKESHSFSKVNRNNNDGILGDKIKTFFRDSKNRIWIGYWGDGLDLYEPESKTFKNFNDKKGGNKGPNNNNIMSITEDKNGIIWLGTFGGGLNKFDSETGKFTYFSLIPNDSSTIADINIWALLADKNGTIWIGTSNGYIDFFDPNKEEFTHIRAFDNLYNGFTPQSIFEDKFGRIWIGTTGGGLKLLQNEDLSFQDFTLKSGLASGNITSIIEDDKGIIWLGTYKGISKFNYEALSFTSYDLSDGLQDLYFNRGSVTKLRTGELMFGGVNGFNIFHPDSIFDVQRKLPLVISNFQLFNKEVKIDGEHSPLSKSISRTNEIVLNQHQDVISLEYVALSFSVTDKIQYAYQLENFTDPSWQYVDKERKVTYTNLKAGEYTFRVRASTNGANWEDNEVSLIIKILPPWWATWWFRLLAISFSLALVIILYRIRFNFLEKQKKILERQVETRTEELDKSNKQLFEQKTEINAQNEELQASQEELNAQNNELTATLEKLKETQGQLVQSEKMASLGILTAGIAHEINNPINFINSGVIGLKKTLNNIFLLLKKYEEVNPENVKEKLQEIQDFMEQIQFSHTLDLLIKVSENISIGVERTTEIIQGLKIFSRQDNQKIDNYNIHKGLDSTLLLISSQFKDRIEVEKNYSPLPEIKACPGKINQVFMNILINAFQAIEAEGTVLISTSKNGLFAKVSIKDNGNGMPEDISRQIFDPFFTTKEVGKGTGLGLFISHGILEEHGGEIKVKSEPGNGTEFTIYLPLRETLKKTH